MIRKKIVSQEGEWSYMSNKEFFPSDKNKIRKTVYSAKNILVTKCYGNKRNITY